MIDASEIDSQGFGLRHYLEVTRRRKWLVLTILLLAVGAAAAASYAQSPVYRARTKIVIGQGNGLFQPNVANAATQPITATMSDLLTSPAVARGVIDNLGLDMSEQKLLSKISVSNKPESSALVVSVVDHSRQRARTIAQEVASVFTTLVKERFGKATPVGPGQTPLPPLTATIWDSAHVDPAAVSPRPVRNVAIAGALGIVLGLLAGFLRDHFDRALRNREAVEKSYGVPVIGQIPAPPKGRRYRRRVDTTLFGESAEAYRALRANLQYLAVQRPLHTLLITSASPQQGKTTVTANLAAAIARSGASTIALEGDLRRPRLAEAFGSSSDGRGVTNVLVGTSSLEEAVVRLPVLGTAGAEDSTGELAFLPSGPLPPNPSELLSSSQMNSLLAHLNALYDYVLIDSPPVLLVADALELARMVDGVVMVTKLNRATTDEAREVRSVVERLDIHLLGTVITDAPPVTAYYGEYRATREPEEQRPSERRESVATK
jgi:receptor protein-tyrosine kinase